MRHEKHRTCAKCVYASECFTDEKRAWYHVACGQFARAIDVVNVVPTEATA